MKKNLHIINSLINCFLSIGCFICIHICHILLLNKSVETSFIAAFGASAVLVFYNHKNHLSFVKVILISGMAAFIGVSLNLSDLDFIYKISLAIGICILLINLTRIHYPPAGAIVIIPLIAGDEIKELGYMFVLFPTLTGITIIYLFIMLKQKIKLIS